MHINALVKLSNCCNIET